MVYRTVNITIQTSFWPTGDRPKETGRGDSRLSLAAVQKGGNCLTVEALLFPCSLIRVAWMQLNRLLTDDDAVSPVIGVILMVGVVVILAAVTASFALSFADGGGSSAPQVSLDSDYNDTNDNVVTLTVEGGDTFDAENVEFEGDLSTSPSAAVGEGGDDWTVSSDFNDGDSVSAGDSIEIRRNG